MRRHIDKQTLVYETLRQQARHDADAPARQHGPDHGAGCGRGADRVRGLYGLAGLAAVLGLYRAAAFRPGGALQFHGIAFGIAEVDRRPFTFGAIARLHLARLHAVGRQVAANHV